MDALRPAVALTVLAFLLSYGSAVFAQDAVAADGPLTLRARAHLHLDATVGADALGGTLLAAAVAQLQDSPRTWPDTAGGYARRYAAYFGQNAAKQGIELAGGALLRQDPRYRRRGDGSVWRRSWHAVSSVAVAHTADGSRRPAWFRAAGAYGSAAVANVWYPEDTTDAQFVLAWGTLSLGSDAFSNLWQEFWPDLRRWVRSRGAATAAPSHAGRATSPRRAPPFARP